MDRRGRYRNFVGSVVASVIVVAAACGDRTKSAAAGDSTEGLRTGDSSAAMPALSWRLESPPSWDDRVRMVDDPQAAPLLRERAVHSAKLFEYLPRDTSIVPQVLLGVYVYDSTAWAKVSAEDGPPQGEVVARGPGVVYVVGFPQSNPFGSQQADSVEFEKRAITMEYVKRAFRVVR